MKTSNRISRQQVADGVVDFQAQNAQIGEASMERLTTSFSNAPEKTFDTEEISVRKFLGCLDQKFSGSRTEIHFNRSIILEDLPQRKRPKNAVRKQFHRFVWIL